MLTFRISEIETFTHVRLDAGVHDDGVHQLLKLGPRSLRRGIHLIEGHARRVADADRHLHGEVFALKALVPERISESENHKE